MYDLHNSEINYLPISKIYIYLYHSTECMPLYIHACTLHKQTYTHCIHELIINHTVPHPPSATIRNLLSSLAAAIVASSNAAIRGTLTLKIKQVQLQYIMSVTL